jgi:iron complex transport system ATP-binding protein
MALMLKVSNLSFQYTFSNLILKNITFNINKGEILALLGPNGTGKTTLMRCLLGLLKPNGGQTELMGCDLRRLSPRKRATMMAYVPQSSTISFPYLVLEVVMMGRIPHLGLGKAPSKEDRLDAEKAMAAMDITHLANSYFQRLSGGEKQLVIIARALAQKASFLVLDEPLANLDFYNQAQSLKILKSLTRLGHTVLWTTHSPDQAMMAADRLMMIKDGQVFAFGPPNEVITSKNLSALYGLKTVVTDTSVISLGKSVKVCVPVIEEF